MKPQTRPFTVETKGRRGQASPSANWASLIDEPTPDDVPSRDIRHDVNSERSRTPIEAAFSAFAATATSLAETAASVFAPKRQDVEDDAKPVAPPTSQPERTGRILRRCCPRLRSSKLASQLPSSLA